MFGTFLYKSEKERKNSTNSTISLWSVINRPENKQLFVNSAYNFRQYKHHVLMIEVNLRNFTIFNVLHNQRAIDSPDVNNMMKTKLAGSRKQFDAIKKLENEIKVLQKAISKSEHA